MNFSEFSESYDKGEKKKSARKNKKRRGDNPGDKSTVGKTHPFNVIGNTGMDGDGYAWEEDIGANMNAEMNESQMSGREQRKAEETAAKHIEDDNRMRYGKAGKPHTEEKPLRPGEVRKWDKENKKWVSNKD